MTNTEIDNIFKSSIGTSYYAALRAVYNAGYFAGAGITPDDSTPDASTVQTAPDTIQAVDTP